jgi:hypothetical protein
MANYYHVDYTAELNRIIVALTDIRDDIRTIRRRGEDCTLGLVTNTVLNDLDRALLAVSLGSGGGLSGTSEEINSPSTTPFDGGLPTDPTNETTDNSRTTILNQLGLDDDEKTLIRINGLYYYEQAYSGSGPDDGSRTNFVIGSGVLGYHSRSSNIAVPGSPPSADSIDVTATKKRWPALRKAGVSSIPTPGNNFDLINPSTRAIVGKSIEEINSGVTTSAGNSLGVDRPAAPPAVPGSYIRQGVDPGTLTTLYGDILS